MNIINEFSLFAISFAIIAASLAAVFSNCVNSMSRNSENSEQILKASIIGATLIEMTAMFILILFFLTKK